MKRKVFISTVLNFAGGVAVGMFIAACFIFENSEIRANAVAFWRLIF